MTKNDVSTIKQKIAEIKSKKQLDEEQIGLSQRVSQQLQPHFLQLGEGFGIIAKALEKLEKAVKENHLTLPDKQEVVGEVKIANPKDFRVEKVHIENPVSEITVKNPPDVDGIRKDLMTIVETITDVQSTMSGHQLTALNKVAKLLESISQKQTDQELLDALKPLRFLSSDPLKPLSVRLSDGEKFYKAFAGIAQQIASSSNTANVEALLQQIVDNTDTLELNAENVSLNTDDLEELMGRDLFHDFVEATVPTATETNLATFTVPALKKARLKGIQATGDADAIFRLYVNSTKKWQGRIEWTERNINANLEVEAVAGDVIRLKVEHNRGANRDFQGMIYGFIL